MDVQMPEMDGMEATRIIRDPNSRVMNNDVPIIAMTAHAMTGDREKCLEAGMNDYVAKPVRPAELAAALERCLGESESKSAKPAPGNVQQHEEQIFDRQALLDRLDGDAELLNEILKVFLNDCPRQLEGLRNALAAGDAESIERFAHALKGAAGNVGAQRLQSLALEMENNGRKGSTASAAQLLDQMEQAFEELRNAVLTQTAMETANE